MFEVGATLLVGDQRALAAFAAMLRFLLVHVLGRRQVRAFFAASPDPMVNPV